ncbi:GntR family transcriptional regulator [Pantoea cypripedii]|uniref:GntR family transcriptional regulator n=1 Tax=Pantoea cypripedii TaxID=55209 RepID=A0A1X1EJN6_PANCY|nr:GntR family transcriptional regulator [Pantoea cypripedii]MBP2200358.1 GntR family transcriptional regulator [Pantoea cypripedii]ORM89116.1 GntR family transcriptional regulator [Pantoea cypripedii]
MQKKNDEQDVRSFGRLSDGEGAPLYEVVKRHISESILQGELTTGTVLPSENSLAADFGVSVGTIRKALAALTSEGMLMRRRKTGTVVTGWAPLHNLSHFFQYFRLHDKQGGLLRSQTSLLDYQRDVANEAEASKLQIAAGDAVYRLKRSRRVNGYAAMHETLILPATRLPDFPAPEAFPSLLYRYLFEHYDIRVAAVREQITACLATEEDARLLEVAMPHAVLVIDEVSYDQSAVPVILAHHRFSTEHFMYVNEIR